MNERNELTEGSRSTLFVRQGGTLVTPPLDAGVLAGILRAKLLESGEATEGYVELQDLERADAVFVGSAARGLVPVTYRSISRLGEDR